MARSRLGPLALESRLGSDPPHSSVWRAIHVEQRKALAVKIFTVPFGGTPEARREFAREWETLKRLRHGSIARCYGGGFEENDAYLAYEIIEGESLADRVIRRQRLPWEVVLDEAEPLAEALAHAHDRQVIHGGLAPDKIRLAGLAPAIVDFRVDRYGSAYRSQRPPSPFELAFRAPEVLENPRNISAKSDLYSLGALLFYALSGRPPVQGETAAEVTAAAASEIPPKVASLVLDCPIWLSSLVAQLLEKNPAARPHGAAAVSLALREVRRRAAEGTGVAEHTSAGFSPLQLGVDKAEARALLGHLPEEEEKPPHDGTAFYERAWFLFASLLALLGVIAWVLWPLNESQLREEAEVLIAQGHRGALNQAKVQYLEPMLRQYPDGEHAAWAQDQIEQIEMVEAERLLDLKLSRGAKLSSEGERLYAAARQYEQFGDTATALDKYDSLITLLGEREKQRPFVNLARRQIAAIKTRGGRIDEGQRIVSERLAEADALAREGETIEARKIWYSIIELYEDNREMAPMVAAAQDRLARISAPPASRDDLQP
ncbi:serine/threonine-protein kinase [Candidatus Laterigemmans baculatus]|uniref:serine/threonine-protein kinase n=1 Tax=Candidatus Laterigemmans baculatus TaxID=2770505 RepID=UPI0013D9311B|nr:serine/threonine-protein kinase [Candidatus Laterigemmans baculatus]